MMWDLSKILNICFGNNTCQSTQFCITFLLKLYFWWFFMPSAQMDGWMAPLGRWLKSSITTTLWGLAQWCSTDPPVVLWTPLTGLADVISSMHLKVGVTDFVADPTLLRTLHSLWKLVLFHHLSTSFGFLKSHMSHWFIVWPQAVAGKSITSNNPEGETSIRAEIRAGNPLHWTTDNKGSTLTLSLTLMCYG